MSDNTDALRQECADFAKSLRSTYNAAGLIGKALPSFLRAAELFEHAAAALAQRAAIGKLAKFGALVIRAHRNDFGINDLDGGELQEHAEAAGVLERREVTQPCGEGCECACACDFPTFCYFLAPDVSAELATPPATPAAEGQQ